MTAVAEERRRTTPVRHLFGIPVAGLTMPEAVEVVDQAIAQHQRLLIGVVNAAKVVNMRRDKRLRDSVLASDVILADGFAVVAAAKVLGRPLPERVAGIDLMYAILERGQTRGYRVFCLGATAEVLSLTERAIASRYPGIELVGRHHGYFTASDEPKIAAAIRNANADVLFVAMTSPRKEEFLAAWSAELNVPVCHGVGGAFDVVAGKVRRAPQSWQRVGLEWLYRVVQEPRRMWKRYLVTNSMFVGLLCAELCRDTSARLLAAVAVRRTP